MTNQLKWYVYRQNNPGGKFRAPALNVYVQAMSSAVADAMAQEVGLYFDGVDDGEDCSCCGDRWTRASEYLSSADEPAEKPSKWDIECAKRANGTLAMWIRADGAVRVEVVT